MGAPGVDGPETVYVPSGSLPGRVWTMALLYACAGLLLAVTALRPPAPETPTGGYVLLAGYAGLTAAGLLAAGRRTPTWATGALVSQYVVLASLLVALARTDVGALTVAFGYVPVALYAAYWSTRRMAAVHAATIAGCFGVALLLNGTAGPLLPWLVVNSTTAAVVVVLGGLVTRLRRAATVDPLTGLLNRYGLAEAIAHLPTRPDAAGRRTVVAIDLDGFKAVNDEVGHLAGDRLLAELGAGWRTRLRAGDLAARTGGDEFLLVLRGGRSDAEHVVARLQEVSPLPWGYGVADWAPGEPLDVAVARADRGLYARKRGAPDGAGPTR